ncbi:LPS export ABC transporter periplasmic protein LptC, partial [Candidatus Pelagibacter sp.]|nr:LPS export ABC transporter periplasmic protein LptC [Candidatus Pelagibacter sp.]
MNKKTLLQGLIVFLITLILLIFYAKYFFERNEVVKKNSVPKKNVVTLNNSSTYIDDVDYVSSDSRGNRYQITAGQGEIKIENSDIMFLTNVIAY